MGCLLIFIMAIIFSLFIKFPMLSFLILAAIIIVIGTIGEQNKLQNKILIAYLEYYESMKEKDNVMSYEEFKPLFIDSIKKERREAAKKHREYLANESKKYRSKPGAFESFWAGLTSHDLRTASTNRSGRRRKK